MFKRNWYLFTPLILVVIPALIFAYYTSSFGYGTTDAMNATKHFLTSGTRYPMNFTEQRFDRLRAAMDGRQVFDTMGQQPFERHDNDTRWIYSLPNPGAKAYHERVVIMERDGQNILRVKSLVRRFHVPGE